MKRKPRNKVARKRASDSFFIVVNPVGSKFAKALQQALSSKITANVLRTNRVRDGRSFQVTTNPLNKIEQFKRFESNNVSSPGFCTSALNIQNLDTKVVFARTLVNATNGRGIVEYVVGDGEPPVAPLYTAYIPKKAEYRVHVFNG